MMIDKIFVDALKNGDTIELPNGNVVTPETYFRSIGFSDDAIINMRYCLQNNIPETES